MLRVFAFSSALFLAHASAFAGPIVINNDEWTFRADGGFGTVARSASTTRFAANLAGFLTGAPGGNILIFSNDAGLNNSALQLALTSAGYTVTLSASGQLDAVALNGFDAVLVGGLYTVDTLALSAFSNSGGGVYIAAGTGRGGPSGEANAWNGFLQQFGLAYNTTSYNGITGDFALTGHPVFNGVSTLYFDNGNTVIDLASASADQQVFGNGLIGIYDRQNVTPAPSPATFAMLGAGLVAFGAIARRRRA